jgi:hypothetical protein
MRGRTGGRGVFAARAGPPAWARAAALAAALLLGAAPAAGAEDILVVFNPVFPLDAPGRADARRAFLDDRPWQGVRIIPAVYTDENPDQVHFVRTVLRMSVKDYDMHWSQLILQEGTTPPRRFTTVDALLHFVARTPNAVGYARHDDAAKVAAYGDRLRVLPWTHVPDRFLPTARKGP